MNKEPIVYVIGFTEKLPLKRSIRRWKVVVEKDGVKELLSKVYKTRLQADRDAHATGHTFQIRKA